MDKRHIVSDLGKYEEQLLDIRGRLHEINRDLYDVFTVLEDFASLRDAMRQLYVLQNTLYYVSADLKMEIERNGQPELDY